MKTLTKAGIEKMAKEIIALLEKEGVANDTAVFFNNKKISIKEDNQWYHDHFLENDFAPKFVHTIFEGINPLDCFEYANPHHVLSMTFEGEFYEIINYTGGKILDKFGSILHKYGVYSEQGNAWNLSCFPIDDDMKIETTEYKVKGKPIYVYWANLDEYPDLKAIIEKWQEYQEEVGDVGSCVLGAGFHMVKDGVEYELNPCSRYQGSISWERNVDDIKKLLIEAGYEDIYFNYGRMD